MGIAEGVAMAKGIFFNDMLAKILKNIAKLDPFLNRKRGVG